MTQDNTNKLFGAKKLLGSFSLLTFGKVAGDLFIFLMLVTISRKLGQEGVGQYSFAIGFTGFFVVFADYGLYTYGMRELSKPFDSFQQRYGPIWVLRLLLSVIVLAVLLAAAPFIPFSDETKLIVVIVGIYQLLLRLVEGVNAAFLANEDMHLAGPMDAAFKGLGGLSAIAVLLLDGSLIAALTVLTTSVGLHILITNVIAVRRYGRPRILVSPRLIAQMIKEAAPFGVHSILSQLQSRIDVVLLGFLIGAIASGIYNVGFRVIFILIIIPNLAYLALFPVAYKLFHESVEDFKSLFHKSMNMVILFSLPLSVGLWLTAPDIIHIFFGEEFEESIIVLRIHAATLFFLFMVRITSVFLAASDNQGPVAKYQWISASVNVIGNLALIPLMGVAGAAIASVVSEGLFLILLTTRLRHVVGWPNIGSRMAISSLATAGFVIPYMLLHQITVMVAVPACVLIYAGVLILFKETRNNEVSALLKVVNRNW